MKSVIYITLLLLSSSLPAIDKEKPLSVLIIGGGPVGLATAIEAKNTGYTVTVVEKRETYSRPQWLFLVESSLKLLEKWNVQLPQMNVASLASERLGFVQIKHLEEQLQKRTQELDIQKIHGKFLEFKSNRAAIIEDPNQNKSILSYDVIVGADGSHSKVRESLNIENDCLGKGFGASALILNCEDSSTEIDISPAIQKDNFFVRRIKTSSITLIFTQSPLRASENDLKSIVEKEGWNIEAKALNENKAFVLADIEISLQQAKTFSNEEKSALLVGDAAASASFFQGNGLNSAFKTSEIAGLFFKELQIHNKKAFQNFNEAMQEITDDLIEDSAFLFNLKKLPSSKKTSSDLEANRVCF